jgi:hypothetical protein
MLGLELTHAHQVKQLVGLALHEAGRRASVTAASHNEADQALKQALSPIFTPSGQYSHPQKRLEATRARYRLLYDLPLWQLKVTPLENWERAQQGQYAVRLDLLYLHEPLQPWLRNVLKHSLIWLQPTPNHILAKARQQGLVTMHLTRRVVIHTDEVSLRRELAQRDLRPQQPSHPAVELNKSRTEASYDPPRATTLTVSRQIPQENSPFEQAPSIRELGQQMPAEKSNVIELCGVLLCCIP